MNQELNRLHFENAAAARGFTSIAGVDEAGRGPLAGPVVAAAVILPPDFNLFEINDSKKLSEKKRDILAVEICNTCMVGVGIVTAIGIDRVNIRNASLEAMRKSVFSLEIKPDYVLIDGNAEINCGIKEETIVKGDSKSFSIGAASIIAKVFRDRIMKEYSKDYPEYMFEKHKGYPTKKHKELIAVHGLTPYHRTTFNYK